jgi:hypothetical protein
MSIVQAATTFCIDLQTAARLPRPACGMPLQDALAGQ